MSADQYLNSQTVSEQVSDEEVSGAGEPPPCALSDTDVNLSTHTACASPPPEAFQSQAYLARKSSSQFPG